MKIKTSPKSKTAGPKDGLPRETGGMMMKEQRMIVAV